MSGKRKILIGVLVCALVIAGGIVFVLESQSRHEPKPPRVPSEYTLAGTFQDELGCAEDWMTTCPNTGLVKDEATGLWKATLSIPQGTWEFKIVHGSTWDDSFGKDGGSDNIPLSLAGYTPVTFVYDPVARQLGFTLSDTRGGYEKADKTLIADPAVDPGAGNVFYFVMTDRFADSDPSNNTAFISSTGALTSSDDPEVSGHKPTDSGYYLGGDIQGIIDKLDYIQGLGTTAIWLTPPFVNNPVQSGSAGYHGYWITDFTQIDPHLGGDKAMKALIKAAHDKGMKVFFDIICNHTADLISYEGDDFAPYVTQAQKPYTDAAGAPFDPATYAAGTAGPFPILDAATSFPYVPYRPAGKPALVPDALSDVTLYHNRGDIMNWDNQEQAQDGDFSGLDDLMTENPAVVDLMVDIYTAWMGWGVDGYRIDTVKHVNMEFWTQFTAAISAYQASGAAGVNRDFFMFGEVYSGDVANATSPYFHSTDMNSLLDFPFALGVRGYLGGGSADDLSRLYAADDYYITGHSDPSDLVTFLGNHDMGRIGWILADQRVDNPEARLGLANDLLYLTRGQPVVYYGDEQGILGTGGDKAARQPLFPTQVREYQDSPLADGSTLGISDHYSTTTAQYEQLATLAALRLDHPALATGAQVELAVSGPVYAFSRVDPSEKVEIVVALNSSTEAMTVDLTTLTQSATYTTLYQSGSGSSIGSLTSDDAANLEVTVPALGAIVLQANKQVSAPSVPLTDGETGSFTISAGGNNETRVEGMAAITATAPDLVWSQTTFWVRQAGDDEWTLLGTDTGANPRVFDDTARYPAGALLEYRAVNVDAAGHVVAASQVAGVGMYAAVPK
ncbi:MAG: alpha-amylase [Propionibacteriaceae bacterium]|jgi:glycosidase|nr:alpha-amylase [Propionibacteriaceae bacterium]